MTDVPIEDKVIWCVPVGARAQSLVTVIDPVYFLGLFGVERRVGKVAICSAFRF